MGRNHLRLLSSRSDARLTAVADPVPAALAAPVRRTIAGNQVKIGCNRNTVAQCVDGIGISRAQVFPQCVLDFVGRQVVFGAVADTVDDCIEHV